MYIYQKRKINTINFSGPHSQGDGSFNFENEIKIDPDSTTNLSHAQWEERSPNSQVSCSSGRSSSFQLPSPNHQSHYSSPKSSNSMSPLHHNDGSLKEDKQYNHSPGNSVFRVPKGRPPSRSNPGTPQPTLENSTYIKPLPALPPLEHRFDRPNSPIRDWDNIPQSSQKSPRNCQTYAHQNSPGGVKEQSQGTQTMKPNPNYQNSSPRSCNNDVSRSPISHHSGQNGESSNHKFNNTYNNQLQNYPHLFNSSNGYSQQLNRTGYIEYSNNHYNNGVQTGYQDHNYGTAPNYHYYENFSNPKHNTGMPTPNQLLPHEQFYNSSTNGYYQGQVSGIRNGFKIVNNNIIQDNQKEINGNNFTSSFEPYKADKSGNLSPAHAVANIKKENCQWQYCSSNPPSPGIPKNSIIVNQTGQMPTNCNIKQEVQIKRETEDKTLPQCEHQFNEYPNRTPSKPNTAQYTRPPWNHPLVSPPFIKEEVEHMQQPPFDPDFHSNHLQSHQSFDYQVSV